MLRAPGLGRGAATNPRSTASAHTGRCTLARPGSGGIVCRSRLARVNGMSSLNTARARPSASDGVGLQLVAAVPVVLPTGRKEEADRAMGLERGADDCVAKPFSPREPLARLRAVLRRCQVQATLPERDGCRRAYRFAGWELNLRNPATHLACGPGGGTVQRRAQLARRAVPGSASGVQPRPVAVDVVAARGRGQ